MQTKIFRIGDAKHATRTFSKEDVERFSKISGDYNPLHLDKEYAKTTIFKRRVVHGALINAMFSSLLGTHLPGEGSIYCNQETRFTQPVFIGDSITATVQIESIDYEKKRIVLSTTAKNQNHDTVLKGKAMVLYPALKERNELHESSIKHATHLSTKNAT